MQTITVRASSWGALFDCAFKWEGVHPEDAQPFVPRALLGTAIHASTAAFDAARVNGEPISAYDASEPLVHTLQQPEFEVDWRGSDISPREAESTGLTLHTKYCNDISPHFDLVAVELTTKPLEIDCGGGVIVRLTGQLDRARIKRDSHGVGIADVKTGGAAVNQGVANQGPQSPDRHLRTALRAHHRRCDHRAGRDHRPEDLAGKPEAAVGEIVGARQVMAGTDEHPGLISSPPTCSAPDSSPEPAKPTLQPEVLSALADLPLPRMTGDTMSQTTTLETLQTQAVAPRQRDKAPVAGRSSTWTASS